MKTAKLFLLTLGMALGLIQSGNLMGQMRYDPHSDTGKTRIIHADYFVEMPSKQEFDDLFPKESFKHLDGEYMLEINGIYILFVDGEWRRVNQFEVKRWLIGLKPRHYLDLELRNEPTREAPHWSSFHDSRTNTSASWEYPTGASQDIPAYPPKGSDPKAIW